MRSGDDIVRPDRESRLGEEAEESHQSAVVERLDFGLEGTDHTHRLGETVPVRGLHHRVLEQGSRARELLGSDVRRAARERADGAEVDFAVFGGVDDPLQRRRDEGEHADLVSVFVGSD